MGNKGKSKKANKGKSKNSKLTKNQQLWKKETKRINEFIKRAEKRGYRFEKNIIPNTPKRITKKQLDILKNLNKNTLYKYAEFLDDDTGKIVSGVEGQHIERSRAAKKAWDTRRQGLEIGVIEPKIPIVDIVDIIGERLAQLEYVSGLIGQDLEPDYRYIWYRVFRNEQYNAQAYYTEIWKQTIFRYQAANALQELDEYCMQYATDILNCIDFVYWASRQEEVGNWRHLNSKLIILLKAGETPTLDESKRLGEIIDSNELIDEYES